MYEFATFVGDFNTPLNNFITNRRKISQDLEFMNM